MELSPEEITFFENCVQPLLQDDQVQSMSGFVQHGNFSCLYHSMAVAYYSYAFCRKLGLSCDYAGLIRGAMLHDFFLYDWHKPGHGRFHGFTHPKTALLNAEAAFPLSDTERNIIERHMWPLTLRPPKCREALAVCLIDKGCSLFETFSPYCGNPTYGSLLKALICKSHA